MNFLVVAALLAFAAAANGARRNIPKGQKFVYFTVDDGPSTGTHYILDALRETGVKATFFINTNNMILLRYKVLSKKATNHTRNFE